MTRRLPRGSAPLLFLAFALFPTASVRAADVKWDTVRTTFPDTVDDLKALQDTVRGVSAKCTPYTVGIIVGRGAGSGVIVSEDGLVLTAGHVSGEPGRSCILILSDGTRVKGKTLGQNKKMDSGMVKITDKGPDDGKWPYAKLAKSTDLKKGQWLVSLGHPNGYKSGRPPVARLGQVKDIGDKVSRDIGKNYLRTNCTLVGGDSGGPLFDLEGRLVGIHSQIGPAITWNLHVPVDAFKVDWEQLEKGEKVLPENKTKPPVVLGVIWAEDDDESPPKLETVLEGGPADAAGLKAGDVITRFDGKRVDSLKEFHELLRTYKPDTEVEITVKRGTKTVTVKLTLGKRPS